MQAKSDIRKNERLSHECIVKIGDDQALSPYYAVSDNLSETGIHFKSLFELYPGAHILVRIDDHELSRNQVHAKVVWCKKIEPPYIFKYAVGAEFLPPERNSGLKASHPISPSKKAPNKPEGGVAI